MALWEQLQDLAIDQQSHKEEALRRGRFVPGLDPDYIPYWTQNIVCTAVKFLAQAAKRAVTHQREHHHEYTAPAHG